MKSGSLIALAAMGIGGYLILRAANTSGSPQSDPPQLTAPGYRVDGVITHEDAGTTKVLPIVQTEQAKDAQYALHKEKNKDLKYDAYVDFKNAPTATEKIKAAVKVLPKAQAAELSSNLAKLGW